MLWGVLQGCLGKVTTSVGAFGILALLITFLPMILQVGLMQLSIKLSQGVAGLMEASRLEGLLEGAGFVLTMLQALLICYGMMLLSALALLLTVRRAGMDLIYGFAACLCITLLGTGAFTLLVPKGSLEGTVKFALSLFLVAGFLLPFFGKAPNWEQFWNSSRWGTAGSRCHGDGG